MKIDFKSGITATSLFVPCAAGYKIRLLSISFVFSGTVDGDVLEITYARSVLEFLTVSTCPMLVNTLAVSCAIGLGNTILRESVVDPVTGAISFVQTTHTVTCSLPDIWFDFELLLKLNIIGSFTLTLQTLCYETAKL